MSLNAPDTFANTAPEPAERNVDELRQNIEAKKQAIAGTIKRLDERVHRATDWRAQVGDHPYIALGIAAGAGTLLAGFFRRKPTPRERIMDALAESLESITRQVSQRVTSQFAGNLSRGLLKTAAATLVTKEATAYLLNKWSPISKERPEPEDQTINNLEEL